MLDPSAVVDRRTEAEKKAEAHYLKYEEQRAKKAASKSHRERIKDLNEKLANLTEVGCDGGSCLRKAAAGNRGGVLRAGPAGGAVLCTDAGVDWPSCCFVPFMCAAQ